MEESYEIHYEKESDFLEVLFGEPSKCIASEVQDGVFIRKDISTEEVKSIGILGFKKRFKLLKQLIASLNKKLPIEISVASN